MGAKQRELSLEFCDALKGQDGGGGGGEGERCARGRGYTYISS